jgi:hypothetical protein
VNLSDIKGMKQRPATATTGPHGPLVSTKFAQLLPCISHFCSSSQDWHSKLFDNAKLQIEQILGNKTLH